MLKFNSLIFDSVLLCNLYIYLFLGGFYNGKSNQKRKILSAS